jgi:hypothetical protein
MAVPLPTDKTARPWLTIGTPRPVATLPRTPSGMPVVWITQYTTGPIDEVTYTDFGDSTATVMCRCEYGEGRAVIGKQCPIRQRRSILERRCSVCSRKVNPGSPMICIGIHVRAVPLGLPPRRVDTEEIAISREGPAHPACAAYSALTCPRLADRLDDVVVAVTRDYHVLGAYQAFGEGPEHMLPLANGIGHLPYELGAYYLNPIASSSRVISLGEYLRTEAPNITNLPTLSDWDGRLPQKDNTQE